MSRHLRASVQLLAAAGLAVGMMGCDKPSQAGAPPAMPPPMVKVAAAVAQDVPEYVDEIGKCAAYEYVAIMPQVSGKITEIKFTDGQILKKGDPLYKIDERPYKAALDQANGLVAQSKAQQSLAKIEFDRIKDLPRSVEPQEDFDSKQNAIEVAAASVQSNVAAVEVAQVNLDYCTINSPINGRAGQHMVDVGNVVSPNLAMSSTGSATTASTSGAMLNIQRLDPIFCDFTVNEDQLTRVRAEMAKGTLKTLVKLPEDADYHEGQLTFLDNAVQDGSGTIKLRATLKNPDQHFWPGQFMQVRLVLTVLKGAVLVPTTVPQISQQGPYALVVKEAAGKDGKPGTIAEMRPVKLGQRHGDLVVMESGVSVGEQVITDGQMTVQPGGPVTVMKPAPTQPVHPETEADLPDAKKALDKGLDKGDK